MKAIFRFPLEFELPLVNYCPMAINNYGMAQSRVEFNEQAWCQCSARCCVHGDTDILTMKNTRSDP